MFSRGVAEGRRERDGAALLSLVDGAALPGSAAVDEHSLTDEERDLRSRHGLDLEQIGYRRQIRADFRGLARQEYAEDEESCFLASGDSVFELEAIEAAARRGT